MLHQGQIEIIEKILMRTPGSSEWINRAVNYFRFYQDFDQAVSFFTRLLELEPLPSIRKSLLWALIGQQSGEAAKALLETVATEEWDEDFEQLALDVGYLIPDFSLLAEHLQTRYHRQQDLEDLKALGNLFEAMQEIPLELRYRRELLLVQTTFENQANFVEVLYRAGKRQEADQELLQLNKDARDYEQVKVIAELAEYQEDPSLALASYRRLLEWNSEDPEIAPPAL